VQTWHEVYSLREAPEVFVKSIVFGGLVLVRPQYKEMLHPMLRLALWKNKTVFIPIASNIPRSNMGEQKKDVLRRKYLKNQKRLIVFFGFLYPHKGVELLFEIADPTYDQIVIAGEIVEAGGYYKEILRRSSMEPWLGKTTITGFLSSEDIAALLAVADAVILPFRSGGGELNKGSVKAAIAQGVFTITTSLTQNGYDKEHNVYYAKVNDVQEMKAALGTYAGKRQICDADIGGNEWLEIADKHRSFYNNLLS
jgi:glycosyltransferase involved in cell wall biosynthesis